MAITVESIQIALFLGNAPPHDAARYWELAFSARPQGYSTLPDGRTNAVGVIGSTQFAVTVHQTRVDIIATGKVTPIAQVFGQPVEPPPPPLLSDRLETQAQMVAAVTQLLPALSVVRTATVFQGHELADDAQRAAMRMQEFVPNLKLPSKTRDATFQVVVPRPSSIASRDLTVICRWQTATMQLLGMQIGASPNAQFLSKRFLVRQYVDVAVDASEALTSEQALASLGEVIEIAGDIVERGYDGL